MTYGLIGEHLPHSFSKTIHERIGRYAYELKELTPEELGPFLTARDFLGLNVTIPYKQAVIPYLDELDDAAAAIGAVNTIVRRDGKLYGYNTDFGGLRALILRLGLDLRGKRVRILGTGGTSKTALAVAEALGAASVLRVSRRPGPGLLTYAEAEELGDAQIVINTTPVGMYPDLDGCPIDLGAFPKLEGVVDVVYNPLRTRLVLAARERGLPAAGGLYMLVVQAVLACERFTGAPVDPALTGTIYAELLRQKENLVLIGMPGSGKSTVGRLLAQKTGRPFVDSDAEIVRRAGKPIPAIFAEDGEPAFRDLETAVLRDLSRAGGQVLATGGGAVLRPENVAALRQNGRLILLNRPLTSLRPSEGRPLGDSAAKLAALYQTRRPIYLAAADTVIENTVSAKAAACQILTEWGKEPCDF